MINKFEISNSLISKLLILVLLVSCICHLFNSFTVFKKEHWDVPIYFEQARNEVDVMPYLKRFDWDRVKSKLTQSLPINVGEYRELCRWGNHWIIAKIYGFSGPSLNTICFVRFIYALFLIGFIIFLYYLLKEFYEYSSQSKLAPSEYKCFYLTSLLAVILSNLYFYLNGQPISEVPALLTITAFCYFYSSGARTKSIMRLIFAGLCFILSYFVRLESILFCFFFAIGYDIFEVRDKKREIKDFIRQWAMIIATILIVFIPYSFNVGSIVNPYYFLYFAILRHPEAYQRSIASNILGFYIALGWTMPWLLLICFTRKITNLRRPFFVSLFTISLASFFYLIMILKHASIEVRMFSALLPFIVILMPYALVKLKRDVEYFFKQHLRIMLRLTNLVSIIIFLFVFWLLNSISLAHILNLATHHIDIKKLKSESQQYHYVDYRDISQQLRELGLSRNIIVLEYPENTGSSLLAFFSGDLLLRKIVRDTDMTITSLNKILLVTPWETGNNTSRNFVETSLKEKQIFSNKSIGKAKVVAKSKNFKVIMYAIEDKFSNY